MRKFTKTDSAPQVLTPEAHKKAQETLQKQGNTSASQMDDEQRQQFADELDKAE